MISMFLVDATTSSSLPIFLQATAAISRERPRIVGSQSDITTYSEARSFKKKVCIGGGSASTVSEVVQEKRPKVVYFGLSLGRSFVGRHQRKASKNSEAV